MGTEGWEGMLPWVGLLHGQRTAHASTAAMECLCLHSSCGGWRAVHSELLHRKSMLCGCIAEPLRRPPSTPSSILVAGTLNWAAKARALNTGRSSNAVSIYWWVRRGRRPCTHCTALRAWCRLGARRAYRTRRRPWHVQYRQRNGKRCTVSMRAGRRGASGVWLIPT